MARAIDDLWPDDIAPTIEQVPPVTILKQQAALLGRRTKNVIEGEVKTEAANSRGFLRHTFYLVAPALNFYRYPLLTVEHPVTTMYPAKITVSGPEKDSPKKKLTAKNEQLFKKYLKLIFSYNETKKITGALLAQSLGQQQSEE